MAFGAVYLNVVAALKKESLEERVNFLIFVVLVDVIILMSYNLIISDPIMGIFLTVKYIIFSFINFDATLKQNL
jgi:hypothetical protein